MNDGLEPVVNDTVARMSCLFTIAGGPHLV
jgi:hypothetical protein